MLVKSPLNRLAKLSLIKLEPWFEGFPFADLISMNLDPPYKPSFDTDNSSLSNLNPYLNHVKNFKPFKKSKEKTIEKNIQMEYDKWFKNF
jgi:hypothetical protein